MGFQHGGLDIWAEISGVRNLLSSVPSVPGWPLLFGAVGGFAGVIAGVFTTDCLPGLRQVQQGAYIETIESGIIT